MTQAAAHSPRRVSAALASIVPGSAYCSATPVSGRDDLHEDESPLIHQAISRRRDEFAAGRRCARAAIVALGGASNAIGRGAHGGPLWPTGYTGSITHGTHVAAAVVGPTAAGVAYGIDFVDDASSTAFDEVRTVIMTQREIALFSDMRCTAIVFAAKEAAIKLLSPRLMRAIDFLELETYAFDSFIVVEPFSGEPVLCQGRRVGNGLLAVARGEIDASGGTEPTDATQRVPAIRGTPRDSPNASLLACGTFVRRGQEGDTALDAGHAVPARHATRPPGGDGRSSVV